MKYTFNKIFQIAVMMLSVVILLAQSACSRDDDDPSVRDKTLSMLKSKTWHIESVTVDEVDKTADYAGMTLSFTDNKVTVVNAGAGWPSQDAWQFTDDQAIAILRGDGVEIELVTLTAETLALEFLWNTPAYGPGRAQSITGDYVFTFK
jgi:hypothetical protein